MKITHVISSCSPGGAEVFVKDLLIELKKQGIDVALWVMSKAIDINSSDLSRLEFENTYVSKLKSFNIPVQFIGKRPNKDWLVTNIKLHKLFNLSSPDIIHTHLETVSFHVAKALFYNKVKIVTTIHSTKLEHKKIIKYFFTYVFDKFVAISEKVKLTAVDIGIRSDQIIMIFNGINLHKFKFNNRDASKEVKSIILVGRLAVQKNHKNYINAFALLRDRLTKNYMQIPRSIIVGTGTLKNELVTYVQDNQLSEHIEFVGIKNNIPEVLRNSDLYVMSSDWEGLSISLIEAMASGIPIVATGAGSNDEIVENEKSGLIVPLKNPEALADAIYKIINDKELRKRLSKEGPKKAKIFSIEKCAKKHISLYKSLLS